MLGMEVSTESEDIYPSGVCNSCYLILRQKQKGDIRATNLTPHTWLPHHEECQICTGLPSTGGKPKRRKVTLEVKGRPNAEDNTRAILAKLADLDVPHYSNAPLNTTSFLSNPILTDLTCSVFRTNQLKYLHADTICVCLALLVVVKVKTLWSVNALTLPSKQVI